MCLMQSYLIVILAAFAMLAIAKQEDVAFVEGPRDSTTTSEQQETLYVGDYVRDVSLKNKETIEQE